MNGNWLWGWKSAGICVLLGGMLVIPALGVSGAGTDDGTRNDEPEAPVAAAVAVDFADMGGHWAAEQVKKAVADGYVDGYEDGTFRPDLNVTRAEFAKMAAGALKLSAGAAGNGDAWYVPYVHAAVSAGVHEWSDFTSGDWNTPMTRMEMARMASRAAGQDTDDEKQWMYLATKAGLIQGMDETGTLAEEGKTTRAQSVTIIERILDVIAGKTLPVDKHAISRAEVVWHKTNIFTMLPQYFLYDYKTYGRNFDLSALKYTGMNGYSEVEKYVVIDLDDMNDPFRSEIPDNIRWKITGDTWMEGEIGEIPENSYGLLSFNHLVVDIPEGQKTDPFRSAGMELRLEGYSQKLKDQGKPFRSGRFAPYVSKYGMYQMSFITDLQNGHNDVRYVTGNFIPKGELTPFDKEEEFRSAIYNAASVELGQTHVKGVYDSKVDYSLAEE